MTNDKSDHIKMEIIQCFRDEQEQIRDENKNNFSRMAVIESRLDGIEADHKELKQENQMLFGKAVSNDATLNHLEERITKHSKESKDNYNELKISFQSLKDDISEFKGEVLKRLDVNAGRDAVLKVIFGAFAGGIIMYVVKGMLA